MNLPAAFRLACVGAAVAAFFSFGSVAPAPADTGSGSDCAPALSSPFLPWLDPDSYFLAPGGNFESGATGWTLSGASVVSGNEPWKVGGSGDSHSLRLPAGASATAPATCIGLADPTVRFFARNTAPLGLGTLVVTADISAAGLDVRVSVGIVTGGSSFAPTPPLPLLANLTSSLPGSTGTVTLEFTALGGSWQIDDVYLDPFKTN
jgi:hypothetical protein